MVSLKWFIPLIFLESEVNGLSGTLLILSLVSGQYNYP